MRLGDRGKEAEGVAGTRERGGGQLGTVQALTADVRRLIAACGDEGLLGTMVELEWVPGTGRAKAATS